MNAAAANGIGKRFIQLCFDEDKTIRLNAIKEYHKIMGIAPAHTPSVFIQNIFKTQTDIRFGPTIQAIINHDSALEMGDPIDEGE